MTKSIRELQVLAEVARAWQDELRAFRLSTSESITVCSLSNFNRFVVSDTDMTDKGNDDAFNEHTANFLDWLECNGTSTSSKIELADLRSQSAGRGLVAKQDLAEDEELFSIPRALVLTTEACDIRRSILVCVEDPWLSLILAMVYEHQLGSASRWKVYFEVLPTSFDTLMYWSEDELQKLEGSAVLNKIGKAAADETFRQHLVPVIKDNSAAFSAEALSENDIVALCHRMGSIIMAYAFDLESTAPRTEEDDGWEEDSDAGAILQKGMIPLADMLNADADRNNARLFYEDDKVVMKTIKPVQAGEELYNDYGPLPSADVLRRYGYVTNNYAKHDVVEVSLNLIKATASRSLKLQEEDIQARTDYLERLGVLDDGYDISRPSNEDGVITDEMGMLLNTLTMSKADFDTLKAKEKEAKPGPSEQALQLLDHIFTKRASLYPDRLVDLHTPNSNRWKMADAVIEGEKVVLQEAGEWVARVLEGSSGTKKRDPSSLESDTGQQQQTSKKQKR